MERVWPSRLRWRMRGAWQWPTFATLTVGDAVLMHQLPIAGEGPDWVPAVLLAMFFNLVAVAVVGPLLGLLLRRRRRDLPRVVASDYGGTVALVATTAILVGIGLAHRPVLQAERDAFSAQSQAVRRFVAHQAPAEYQRNIDAADSIALGGGLYRTCVPGADPEAFYCLFVDTGESPPGIRVDPNPASNTTFVPDRFP
jgi:hypothetical protein